jgi:hypothetical protein
MAHGKNNSLNVFENWVLRKIFGPRRNEITGNCATWSFVICTYHQTFLE